MSYFYLDFHISTDARAKLRKQQIRRLILENCERCSLVQKAQNAIFSYLKIY